MFTWRGLEITGTKIGVNDLIKKLNPKAKIGEKLEKVSLFKQLISQCEFYWPSADEAVINDIDSFLKFFHALYGQNYQKLYTFQDYLRKLLPLIPKRDEDWENAYNQMLVVGNAIDLINYDNGLIDIGGIFSKHDFVPQDKNPLSFVKK